MVLKKIFNYIYTHRFLTFLVVFFCCLFLFSLDSNSYGYSISDNGITDSDVTRARSLVGESIWNNNNYDIFIFNNMQNSYVGKFVVYFNASTLNKNSFYMLNTPYVLNSPYYCYEFYSRYYNDNNSVSSNSGFYCTFKSLYGGYNSDLTVTSNGYIEKCEVNSNSVCNLKIIRSHYDIRSSSSSNYSLLANATTHFYRYPEITTSSSDIENWSFDYLEIDGGDVSPLFQVPTSPPYYLFYKNYLDITCNGVTYINLIDSFVTDYLPNQDKFTISIPRQALSSYFTINNGDVISFYLRQRAILPNGEIYEDDGFDLGTYTLSLTSQQVIDINSESDKYTLGSIEEDQKETNEKLNDISSSINDSNISDITNDTLPSDSTQDITADGVNGIFTSIYNAFCTGTAQDIVFPIPFTNKTITLSPSYVSTMLISSGATFVITLIQAFWWYLISRFIVKDVMDKINKIKSGNIEKIEETNIRGDML